MDEISMYRKYRPHNFANLVGQEHVKTTLINALKNEHVAHAYLFTGPRGTGKTSSARLIAKALNCQKLKDKYEPCGECEFCKDISDGRLIDLIEVDAASNRGIDEVRDLKEKINFAPTRSKYKVYIIDEVHMMTKEAFNALLKTLEEPPSHVYFILATTEIHKIPETIISRCQRFDFKRISRDQLVDRLTYIAKEEKIEVEKPALDIIAKCVDGGMRDAIGLLEQMNLDNKITTKKVQEILGVTSLNLLESMVTALRDKKTQVALDTIHELHTQGSDLKQFIHEFVDLLREKMLESVAKNDKGLTGRLIEMIDIFQEAQTKLYASIPQLALEIAVIRVTGGVEKSSSNVAAPAVVTPAAVAPAAPVAAAPAPTPTPVPTPTPTAPVAARPVEVKKPEAAKPAAPIETPPAEATTQSGESLNLSLATLMEKWPRITERIKKPSLRMSLRSTVPSKVDGSDVLLQFNTNFHMNLVMDHDNRAQLEALFKEFFGTAVKIDAVVKEMELKPVVENSVPYPEPPAPTSPVPDQSVDQALEIFGGELID